MIKRKAGSLLVLAALGLGLTSVTQQLQTQSREQWGTQVASRSRPGDILMFSSLTCTYCDRARAWLTEHRVPFTECFIEQDTLCKARFNAMMAPGTPVLVVRGRHLVGFDAMAVAAALAD